MTSKKAEQFAARGLALSHGGGLHPAEMGLKSIGQPKFQSKYKRLSPEESKEKQLEIARKKILEMSRL